MKPALFFKIVIMVVALIGVMFAIRGLNSQKMEHALTAIGIEAGGPGAPGLQAGGHAVGAGEERLSICPTRITGILFDGGRKVEEEKQGVKLKWMAYDPSPREIATIEVEKWLIRHCQVVVREFPESAAVGSQEPSVTLRYVDGREEEIGRLGADLFKIEGKVYRSEDLAQALNELQELAQLGPSPSAPSSSEGAAKPAGSPTKTH